MATDERLVECDVLIIGGGLAGTFAAIRARELGNLNVVLVDKAYVSMSGGSSFAGGFSAVFDPKWGHDYDEWKTRIVKTGEYVNNQDWVDIHLENTKHRYAEMVSWGAPYFKDENGEMKVFPVALTITNIRLLSQKFMPPIRKKALQSGVTIMDRIMVSDLLKEDGAVVGAIGFHTREGDCYVFRSKATVVCTGQGTFKGTGYPHDYWTGDGEGMCYRAGASLTSREFGQQCEYIYRRYPSLFCVHDSPFSKCVNALGEEYRDKYYDGHTSPDRLHKAQMFEAHAGNGPLYCDLSGFTPEQAEAHHIQGLQINRLHVRKRLGHNLDTGKHEVLWGSSVGATGPAAGGVMINTQCETEIPGLFAAGDTAGTNMSGALYPAVGFGLTTAVVSGHIAGESAARYSMQAERTAAGSEQLADLKERIYAPLKRKGGFRHSWVTQVLQGTMIPYYVMGIKKEDRMQAALTLVSFIQEHLVPRVKAEDPHELRMANELRNMTLNAEMTLRASLFRTESRGLHYREDYPRRDDANWLAWTVLKEESGGMVVHKQPLPESWYPDKTLSYEEKYDFRFPLEIKQ